MSWLPDPAKFLRRSHRKGDADHQEKQGKSKPPKHGGRLKQSSLYSLMQASGSNSFDKSAEEDDNRSSHGPIENSVRAENSHAHPDAISADSTDGSSTSHTWVANLGCDLSLIRQAASILIANVPSPHAHTTHERMFLPTREDALQTSPHASRADAEDSCSSTRKTGRDSTELALHPCSSADPDASDMPPTEESHPTANETTKEANEEEETEERRGHELTADKGFKTEEALLLHAGHINATEQASSLALPAISDNEAVDTEESECKVISEDPAALARSSQEGKLTSPPFPILRGRRRGNGSRKQSRNRNSLDQGSNREPNTRRNSVPGKYTPFSTRKSPKKGDGKPRKSKKKNQSEQSKNVIEMEEDAEGNGKGGELRRDYDHSSFSRETIMSIDGSVVSIQGSMTDCLSEDEANHSYTREPTFNSRSGGPQVTRREYSFMPQESFAFQGMDNFDEQARSSISWDDVANSSTKGLRSPTLSAATLEIKSSLLMQHKAFQAALDNELIIGEERGRTSVDHVMPKQSSRTSHLTINSPSVVHYQDEDVIGENARVSIGRHKVLERDVRRSPYAARRALNLPVISPRDQGFSLDDDEMIRESARTSVGHDHMDLTLRRHSRSPQVDARSPQMDAGGDLITPSTPRYQSNSVAQASEVVWERTRMGVGYNELEQNSWRRSPLILAKEPNSPMSPLPTLSLQDDGIMEESVRICIGHDAIAEPGSRRSPYMGGMSAPLVHHHLLLQEREERARMSSGHDELKANSRGQSSYMTGRRDKSLLQIATSQRFFLQDDALSVYDMPASPFSASQASVLLERGGSMLSDKAISPFPNSPQFFIQNAEEYCQPLSPVVTSRGFVSSQEDQRQADSPFYEVLPHEDEDGGPYTGENILAMPTHQAAYVERDVQRGYMHDKVEDVVASFYHYKEPPGNYLSGADSRPLLWQQADTLDDEEAFYDEGNEPSVSSFSRRDKTSMMGSHEEAGMMQHFIREQRGMERLHEDGGSHLQVSQYDDRSSTVSSSGSHLMSKQRRSNLLIRAGAVNMVTPLTSPTGSLGSSGSWVLKRLKAVQARVAEVRQVRRGFEDLVVEMVGSGGEDAVQDLLDLEDFVDSYESLSSGGLFKLVVDQFFHELCCELLQPVSQENDSVLCMALFRLEQMSHSSP